MMISMHSGSEAREKALGQEILCLGAGIFLTLAWLIPNHEWPWLSFHAEFFGSGAGICLVMYAVLSSARRKIPLPSAVLATFLIATIPWVQWIAGLISYRGDALLASMYIAGVTVCFWAGFIAPNDRDHIGMDAVAFAMVWSAIVSTGIAFYQWLGLAGLGIWATIGIPGERAIGNLAQSNHLATLLMFGLASVFWLNHKRRLTNISTAIAGAFLVAGVALSGSREPILGLLLLSVWCVRADSVRNARAAQWYLLGAMVVWFAIASFGSPHLATLLDTAADQQDGDRLQSWRPSPELRPLLWSQFVHSIGEAPWFGYGWQGGLTAQASVAINHPGLEFSAYAHNLFLDLLVWNGIPLGLLLFASLSAWYWRVGRWVRFRGGWFQFSILTLFVAHALVEYPHAYTYFLIPVAFLAGQLEARSREPLCVIPHWCIIGTTVIIVAALVAIVVDYLPLAAERQDVIVWQARIGGNHKEPASPRIWVLDQLAASIDAQRRVAEPGMTALQIRGQEIVSRRFPTKALLDQTVLALALNKQIDAAYIELLRLRGLHGELSYRIAVAQVRSLAVTSQPKLRGLVELIDRNASQLPRVPVMSEEMSVTGH